MNRLGRGAVMLAIGCGLALLLLSGDFGWFVQQRMRWPLIAATVIVFLFGITEVTVAARHEEHDPDARRHKVAPGVGILLVLPLVVLAAVKPTGLGAAAAGRVDAFTPAQTTPASGDLDPAGGPYAMPVFEFLERAVWDETGSMEGVTIRLEGLVVNDPDHPGGFTLTRFMVSCCAADGIPLQVRLHGVEEPLDDDTWVVADVVWRPPVVPYAESGGDMLVEADVITLNPLPAWPDDPYEAPR